VRPLLGHRRVDTTVRYVGDAAHRDAGLIAEGIVGSVCLEPQRARIGLDHLLREGARAVAKPEVRVRCSTMLRWLQGRGGPVLHEGRPIIAFFPKLARAKRRALP